MRPVSLRRLLAAVGALALLLAACSTPRTPATPANPVVEQDGFQAQIEMAKVDLAPLSFFNAPETQYCTGSQVRYAQIVVPMLAMDDGQLTPYVDVFWMPRDWNGKLVLYAHGYLDPLDPNWLASFLGEAQGTAPGSETLMRTRDPILCEHYAIGLSSFSAPGYAVREGIIDTHLLNAVFRFVFWRKPARTYVFGSSLGGLITLALAEEFPGTYSGAMPTCGPIGGSLLEMNYIGNVRLLYDDLFHYSVGGTTMSFLGGSLLNPPPAGATLSEQALQSLVLSTTGADPAAFAALDHTWVSIQQLGNLALGTSGVVMPLLQTPRNFGSPFGDVGPLSADQVNALVAQYSLYRALRYDVRGAIDIHERAGGWPFDNRYTGYGVTSTYGAAPVDFQAWQQLDDPFFPTAIAPDASALRYFSGYPFYPLRQGYYQPTGATSVPILSLHTAFDPDVPAVHEKVYRALATAHSTDFRSYVVGGVMPDDLAAAVANQTGADVHGIEVPFGHCNFEPETMVDGFNMLVERASSPSHSWPTELPTGFVPLP